MYAHTHIWIKSHQGIHTYNTPKEPLHKQVPTDIVHIHTGAWLCILIYTLSMYPTHRYPDTTVYTQQLTYTPVAHQAARVDMCMDMCIHMYSPMHTHSRLLLSSTRTVSTQRNVLHCKRQAHTHPHIHSVVNAHAQATDTYPYACKGLVTITFVHVNLQTH